MSWRGAGTGAGASQGGDIGLLQPTTIPPGRHERATIDADDIDGRACDAFAKAPAGQHHRQRRHNLYERHRGRGGGHHGH